MSKKGTVCDRLHCPHYVHPECFRPNKSICPKLENLEIQKGRLEVRLEKRSRMVLVGSQEICAAVGENPKEMVSLVNKHGLPAWKRKTHGTWRALPEDLKRWVRELRDMKLKRHEAVPYCTSPGVSVKQ